MQGVSESVRAQHRMGMRASVKVRDRVLTLVGLHGEFQATIGQGAPELRGHVLLDVDLLRPSPEATARRTLATNYLSELSRKR